MWPPCAYPETGIAATGVRHGCDEAQCILRWIWVLAMNDCSACSHRITVVNQHQACLIHSMQGKGANAGDDVRPDCIVSNTYVSDRTVNKTRMNLLSNSGVSMTDTSKLFIGDTLLWPAALKGTLPTPGV